MAKAIATLDILVNFSQLAQQHDWQPPTLSQEASIHITAGRHPIIEQVLSSDFIANDTTLTAAEALHIITGPNMGGKSTYMRQVALIVIMAYTGCFVPAKSATIGPIDRIFTRIGASDHLAQGHSTFMVEMTEAANILHHATPHSLVIMDEIGRGTSTYDGLSLAWATAQYLAKQLRCFCLFATHYFEMTNLSEQTNHCVNYHLDATEQNKKVIFLHKLKKGPASQSYGIHVAQLAGLPPEVIDTAIERLHQLENESHTTDRKTKPPTTKQTDPLAPWVQLIVESHLEQLTPLEAMALLDKVKKAITDHLPD